MVNPPQGIELVTLHQSAMTIPIAIHRAGPVTANAEVIFFACGRKSDLNLVRQTKRPAAFGVDIDPQATPARDPRSVGRARNVVLTDAGRSAAFGDPGRHLKLLAVTNLEVIANLEAADDPSDAALVIPRKGISGVRRSLNRGFLHVFDADRVVQMSERVQLIMANAKTV